jgi:hypothetical protein
VATIEERLTALEQRVQELEHGVAPQLLALHATVNHSHEILLGVQQAVLGLRGDMAAQGERLDRVDGRLSRLEDGQSTLVQGQIALIDSQAELRTGLTGLQAAVETLGRRLPPGAPATGP